MDGKDIMCVCVLIFKSAECCHINRDLIPVAVCLYVWTRRRHGAGKSAKMQ